MKTLLMTLALMLAVGCQSRGLNRLLHGPDKVEGTPYVAPVGDLNATPIYDQTTATVQQDDALIARMVGSPSDPTFQIYVHEPWLPLRMNGVHNLAANSKGYSSILVDSWKAIYRRGYADASLLEDPSVIHSNRYPVPVYQDDAGRWGL